MAVTASKILSVATAQVGTAATNIKKCKYNDWFYGVSVSGSGYDWCETFVQWVFNQAGGLSLLHGKTANCGVQAAQFKSAGELIYNKDYSVMKASQVKAGDVVLFHWDNSKSTFCSGVYSCDHVGIIKKVNSDGTITTIEGNTGGTANGAVMERTRALSLVSCVGRPKYASENPDPTPDKPVTIKATVNYNYLGKSGYNNVAAQVKTVQRLLNALGYKGKDNKTLTVDGGFGVNTEYAVKSFQTKNKVSADGVVGVITWRLLTGGK